MPKNPHADFSPVLDGYSGIGAFRFWCQTALPLTYDDSLSYYELLNKVVNYLNHTIEDLTAVENNTSALAEAFDNLQKYVNDYFDDLDVEAELRNVLDAMAEDGTLDALLDPLVENKLPGVVDEKIDGVVAEQIDGVVAGQIGGSVAEQLPALVDAGIPGEVSGWLEENVDPVGSAVMVDSSLTISGAAADAKATGDKVDELKTQLNEFTNEIETTFESGGWYVNPNTNTITSNTSSGKVRTMVGVYPGCTYQITFCSYGSSANVIIFADQFHNKITSVKGESSRTNMTVYQTAPEEARFLYVTHDNYLQSAVTPKICLVNNAGYADHAASSGDALVNYMGAGIKKENAVESTNYLGYISSAGVVKASRVQAQKVYIYPVTAGNLYKLEGTGVSIDTGNPIAALGESLYDGTNDLTCDKLLIYGTSNTPTNYDLLFAPENDGYVYIATYSTNPQVVVYNAEYKSERIDDIHTEIAEITEDIADVKQDLTRISEEMYDFSSEELFTNMESSYIDDFTSRESFVDADHVYTQIGSDENVPVITTGTGATRKGTQGGSTLGYSRRFSAFPYFCLIGRVQGKPQTIKLYSENTTYWGKVITINKGGAVQYDSVTYGYIHADAKFNLFCVTQYGVTIYDDCGLSTYIPVEYQSGDPKNIAMMFPNVYDNNLEDYREYGYSSFVEFVKKPLQVVDFDKCLLSNENAESQTPPVGMIGFTHSTWENNQINDTVTYTPEGQNPWQSLTTGLSNNACIKLVADYNEDLGYRTEIYVAPVRGTLKNKQGGIQRFVQSADYYMDGAVNLPSEDDPYMTHIMQLHDINFAATGWSDPPPVVLSVVWDADLQKWQLRASVNYISDGSVPNNSNRVSNRYTLCEWEMNKWYNIELEVRIGWRDVLAPRAIIRVNGIERMNIQTPVGYNIVNAGGSVRSHFGLYMPQWHDNSLEITNKHREILVTNIKWKGTLSVNS